MIGYQMFEELGRRVDELEGRHEELEQRVEFQAEILSRMAAALEVLVERQPILSEKEVKSSSPCRCQSCLYREQHRFEPTNIHPNEQRPQTTWRLADYRAEIC